MTHEQREHLMAAIATLRMTAMIKRDRDSENTYLPDELLYVARQLVDDLEKDAEGPPAREIATAAVCNAHGAD